MGYNVSYKVNNNRLIDVIMYYLRGTVELPPKTHPSSFNNLLARAINKFSIFNPDFALTSMYSTPSSFASY